MSSRRRRSCWSVTIRPNQHPLLAWQIRNDVRLHRAKLHIVNSQPIKLTRQATSFTRIPAGSEGAFARYLAGEDAAAQAITGVGPEALAKLRDLLRAEVDLVVVFGSELRGDDIAALVRFGAARQARFICLGDYANSRGAADMGLYPDLLPGYAPLASGSIFDAEWGGQIPAQPGLSLAQMFDAARDLKLHALYVVGSNPVARDAVGSIHIAGAFPGGPGHVHDGDSDAGRRDFAGSQHVLGIGSMRKLFSENSATLPIKARNSSRL